MINKLAPNNGIHSIIRKINEIIDVVNEMESKVLVNNYKEHKNHENKII